MLCVLLRVLYDISQELRQYSQSLSAFHRDVQFEDGELAWWECVLDGLCTILGGALFRGSDWSLGKVERW